MPTNITNTWPSNLTKGDEVIVIFQQKKRVGVVERLTKTQVILTDKTKYGISDKMEIGNSDWYSGRIEEMTDLIVNEIDEAKQKAALVERIAKRSMNSLTLTQLEKIVKVIG
jgi:hypothetical protein